MSCKKESQKAEDINQRFGGEVSPEQPTTLITKALSIRQPYAEQILRGEKQIEFRSKPTKVRERIYLYAGLKPGAKEDWEKIAVQPGELPTGVLVGTVEVVNCTGQNGDYHWHLAKPERLPVHLKPEQHPQPAWFHPFPPSPEEKSV